MKKMKLNLDELTVESFEINNSNKNRGTVNGLGTGTGVTVDNVSDCEPGCTDFTCGENTCGCNTIAETCDKLNPSCENDCTIYQTQVWFECEKTYRC